jgi:hypothetical protein
MSWLAISGIDLSAIAATAQDPKGDRRDIGDVSPANDGTMRATRQVRKRDFSFQTVPLKGADAFVWESLITGAGDVWSFDSSKYSSKGTGGDGTGTTIQASVVKFGAGALKVPNGDTWETVGLGLPAAFTMAVWYRVDSGAWNHWVWQGGGTNIWLNGVRTPGGAHPFDYDSGDAILEQAGAGTNFYFDDFVACPYLWPATWPALVYGLGAAFSPLPYLTCAGDLVPEAATRSMIGKASVAKVLRANPTTVAGGAAKDVQVLQVDLMER